MTYPDYKFYCTCRTSRKVFGKDLPNHQLHTVAERCGYHLENHHHALADAEACAQIALLIIPEPKKTRKTKKADNYVLRLEDRFCNTHFQAAKFSQSAKTAQARISRIRFLFQVINHLMSVVGTHSDRAFTTLL